MMIPTIRIYFVFLILNIVNAFSVGCCRRLVRIGIPLQVIRGTTFHQSMNGTQTLLRDTITFVCTREEYSIEKIVLDQIIDLTIDNFLNLL